MNIDTQFLARCLAALEKAMQQLPQFTEADIEYDIYRAAIVKEFEIALEQSGKLLKKRLQPFFHTHKAADRLHFKDIFRQAGQHGLLDIDEVERWLAYRDNRNATAHDYGAALAQQTLPLMPQFITDAKKLVSILQANHDH